MYSGSVMMLMDYGLQYASSTMSSETLSGSCGSRTNRIRTVRLVRPLHGTLPPPNLTCRHGPSLGFSVRGGREHGTGFFVSYVEPGSEAHRQGLKIGDQIVRINGFTVDDAVHKEVLQLISNHTHLTLKVRSVGMIPVKDRRTDTLTWQIIADNSSLRFSPPLSEKIQDVRINIMVAPRSKLGCGICKGPEWKPGIFIQFTKENGIAREAGLRPGDQILFCNNVDFGDIPFNEAVNLMKTSRQLDLIVRKSAGSELFPGESSGYNSSASSVTGDQSPSWSDSKRLSIVKEESLDLEDRLDRLKSKKWEKIGWDEGESEEKQLFKPTIINLSENGTTIKNNGTEEECQSVNNVICTNKLNDPSLVPQKPETKTVVVEVHRTNNEKEHKTENSLVKSSSTSSFGSLASRSSTASNSLSSAICQEIQRRSEKKQTKADKPTIDEQLQMKKILKGVTSEKQHQHNKLMDEFKQAHKKMFKAPEKENEEEIVAIAKKGSLDRIASTELSQKLSERLSNLSTQENLQERLNNQNSSTATTTATPPPPPPPPIDTTTSSNSTNILKANKKGKAPPVPVKTSTLSFQQPPPCPTPDYDTLSITSFSSLPKQNGFKPSQIRTDSNEMESLESFKFNSPGDIKPIPLDAYFNKSSSSNAAMIKKQRPISVTIGEYPSGTMRKTPGRLDFLQSNIDIAKSTNIPITNQFASELAQTLNRSNLKKKTDSMDNLLYCPQIKPQSNGSVRISLNSSLAKSLAKSTSDLTNLENFSKTLYNRVTININSVDKKTDTPNGILKNGTHKSLMHQKSITFGEIPTVINDRPLQVT